MVMALFETAVEQIGATAGDVWKVLDESGPATVTSLVKQVSAPRDVVMQSLGWLAREEKIVIEEVGRKKIVSLC